MLLRTIAPIVIGLVFFCSSPLLAGEAGFLQQSPASTVVISSTSHQQLSPEASCELKVRERYEYYNVDGATVIDLQNQMKHHGTKWGDGRTYAAVTSWDVKFNYDMTDDHGKCSVKSVKTDVEIVYQLPRRISLASSSDLTVLWDKYMVNLKLHEFGHKDIAVKTAGEINEVLASLQNFGSAQELEKEAKRLTDEKLRELKDLQVEYDDETHHGETQGAILDNHGAMLAAQ